MKLTTILTAGGKDLYPRGDILGILTSGLGYLSGAAVIETQIYFFLNRWERNLES